MIYTFGCLSWPWAVGLESSQELVFEGYFRFSLPDPENILQSGSKHWLRAKLVIFYFPLSGEEICFVSVVWQLSQWVVSTPPVSSGAVSTQDGAEQNHETLSRVKAAVLLLLGSLLSLLHFGCCLWMPWEKAEAKSVYVTAQKTWILIFAVDSGPIKAIGLLFETCSHIPESLNCIDWKGGCYNGCKEPGVL